MQSSTPHRQPPSWLDTRTKELLRRDPPDRGAPSDTAAFTLVLLEKAGDGWWLVRALRRIRAPDVRSDPCPVIVRRGLPLSDAMLGQFELLCCDAVSIFARDEVIAHGSLAYLRRFYARMSASPEFDRVVVTIIALPRSDRGPAYLDQFTGIGPGEAVELPIERRVTRRKAKIMAYWALEIGAEISVRDA